MYASELQWPPPMPDHHKKPSTAHPMYRLTEVIPGDHAYNIIVAALQLVLDRTPAQLTALAEGTVSQHTLVESADLRHLFEVIATESGIPVLDLLAAADGRCGENADGNTEKNS